MNNNNNNIEMIIYVSDLKKYRQGINEWVELDLMNTAETRDKYDAFQKEHEENALFISDTSMTYNLGINEFDNIDYILYIADSYFAEWSEEQIKIFSDLINEGDYDWKDAVKIVNNYDYAFIEISAGESDEEAVGRYCAEDLNIPNHIESYFDYVSYGRDIIIETENVVTDDYVILIY